MADAIIVGGGIYGATIAAYLAERRKLRRVILLEQGDRLMRRASFNNQARVHGGYHYPRSFTTAYRSRLNMARFISDFGAAVATNFTCLYAIARRNSKVTSIQMERFCNEIGAPLAPAPTELSGLFNKALIDSVYIAEEPAFNADILADLALRRLRSAGVEICFSSEVIGFAAHDGCARVVVRCGEDISELTAPMAFNCTYSRLQKVAGPTAPRFGLRHEITEMLLVEMPPALDGLGITVMDGPFFSVMPFPARRLHSLSHVRYTPHEAWIEDEAVDPYSHFETNSKHTRADWIVRDAGRYVPWLNDVTVSSSLFEVKTVLTRSDGDDSRPILFERHGDEGRLFSVLGGKIDNVYDIFERLDREESAGIATGINMDALIGYTGFVGSSLLRQRSFEKCYRSTDVQDIRGRNFGLVVCAGVPAKKWIADKNPEEDLANIESLARHLDHLGKVEKMVLISTVDVYPTPVGVDEETPIDSEKATPYGRNRRWLEEFVLSRFENATVVRLPGLVGPGLRKNIIFDFFNNNNTSAIDSRGVFQFYPMVNLWSDLAVALERGLRVVNFSTEPISVHDVSESGFNLNFSRELPERVPARYDMRSSYSRYFGGKGAYLYDRRETILAIRAYAQSEQRSTPAG